MQILTTVAFILLAVIFSIAYFSYPVEDLEKQVRQNWNEDLERDFGYLVQNYKLTPEAEIIKTSDNKTVTNRYIRGKILSLALFYAQAANDPIFYSPRIDTKSWNAVLDKLEIARAEFVDATSKYPPKNKEGHIDFLINPEAVYPLNFLRSFAHSVELQKSFLETPSVESASALIEAQQSTQRSYSSSAAAHQRLAKLARDSFGRRIYLFIGSATNLEVIKNDFDLINKNALELKRELESREKCLKSGFCEGIQQMTTGPSLLWSWKPTSTSEKPVFRIPIEVITPPYTQAILGPYEISSPCWGSNSDSSPKEWPMYLFLKYFEGTLAALPNLANDMFYWNLHLARNLMSQEMIKMGFIYQAQPPTHVYMCTDLSFYPSIMTLYQMQNIIKNEGMVAADDKYLINSSMPSDKILPVLIADYKQIGTKTTRERKLIIENKLVGFYLILGEFYGKLKNFGWLTIGNKEAYEVPTILISRDAYSLLYLTFAKSVWRLKNYPQYLLPYNYPPAERFVTWDELLSTGINPQKIYVWTGTINKEIADRELNKPDSNPDLLTEIKNGLLELFSSEFPDYSLKNLQIQP